MYLDHEGNEEFITVNKTGYVRLRLCSIGINHLTTSTHTSVCICSILISIARCYGEENLFNIKSFYSLRSFPLFPLP